jgi:TP901 family phage tail tape measure protein
VADAYYDIVSGVQDASTHMAILNASVDTATAGQADLKATTSAVIGVMNSYGFAAEDAGHVSDVFTQAVAMGKTTMDELGSTLPDVTGLAASLGISLSDLGSQLSFMTTKGTQASVAGTQLKAMMSTLLNPTADVQAAINALGYDTGEAMINSLGLVGSYEALKEYNGGTFAGLITGQEALLGATTLTSDAYAGFNEKFQATVDGSTAAAKAIQDENQSWDALNSKFQEASITIGSQLSPVIMALIDEAILPAVTAVTAWMTENPELTQQLVLMAGAAVILGPVITAVGVAVSTVSGLVGLATTAWGLLSGAYSVYTAASTAAAAGTAGLGASMLAAAGPIIAVGAAIAGVIAQLNTFNQQVGDAKQFAQDALGADIASGKISRQELDDASFGAVASQFGGGIVGDVIARATYSNVSNAVEGRAIGGGVSANVPYMVGEDGPELFVPDSSGEIKPNGSGGGSPIINIYQQPGESGEALAHRISREMVRSGLRRSAA